MTPSDLCTSPAPPRYSDKSAARRATTAGRIAAALLALVALCPVVSPALAAVPELPPRIQAPTDKAEFRRFTLGNGLRVLLVSDPKFNKSAAALVVNVGQIDDPKEREGLAHFTEHMLFLGSDKYPDSSEYHNFIKSNGGYANAYTTSDHTNYRFEIRHESFASALDRFAQFFIAPRFNPEFTSREINAVHNEAMRHLQNDQRRALGVARELFNPDSGEAKFSTGNKDTLAGATPANVRAFYEQHYTADHMALALTGKASLDELEKFARTMFSAIPRRPVPEVKRVANFLPKKPALRLAYVEPIKEARQLLLEFPIPATRPDFASKPDVLVSELLSYPGPGGLVERLKRDGLVNSLSGDTWERTGDYGSLLITADLTPAGLAEHRRVMTEIFAYLEHLRAAPFPAAFYADRARIAQLVETYTDRGEGGDLAAKLANQALFYPLEVAERATAVWGKPDEGAYRRLLGALTADNMLAMVVAKGLTYDKEERIYKTRYSYREETGAAYAALAQPPKVAAFALPQGNPFMPAATPIYAERPLPLINEPGLEMYYAQDVEFERPQTALIFRFVPVREMASVDSAALLTLWNMALRDYLQPMVGDAALAGISFERDFSLEGLRFRITGFGDSPVRFADLVASKLRDFSITNERYEALRETALRAMKSFDQTEAYQLARERRDALAREFHYLPNELVARASTATWPEVQAFGRKLLAQGKLEAVVHGHIAPDNAVKVTRAFAAGIGAAPAPESALLRRRHAEIAVAENIVDTAPINGVNSAFLRDSVLPDDSPATRASAAVIANFISTPFYSELRTKQQLGYVVGSAAAASQKQRYFTFVVQSSTHAPDDVRARAEAVIAALPAALAKVDDAKWKELVEGVRAHLLEKPKSITEKAAQFFELAFLYDRDGNRREESLAALAALTREQAAALLARTLASDTSRQRTIMLYTKDHPPAEAIKPAFTERNEWKRGRKFS
jgi:secreted Zn-dependent insulinase-like peptidase